MKLVSTFLMLSLVVKAEESSVNQLLRGIRGELPKGWAVSYDEEYEWLEVSRNEAIVSLSALPNGDLFEESEQRTFAFAFRVIEAVNLKDYRRLRADNERTKTLMIAMYQDRTNKRISHKFDSFVPKNKEEEMAVAQYEALKKSLHTLPDFYFGTISLRWAFNSSDNRVMSIVDDRVRDECTRVQV